MIYHHWDEINQLYPEPWRKWMLLSQPPKRLLYNSCACRPIQPAFAAVASTYQFAKQTKVGTGNNQSETTPVLMRR
jgi:hypothetical protein